MVEALLSITPFIYHLSSSYPGHPAFSSGPHFLRGETTVPRLTSIAIVIATARRIPDTTLVEEYEAGVKRYTASNARRTCLSPTTIPKPWVNALHMHTRYPSTCKSLVIWPPTCTTSRKATPTPWTWTMSVSRLVASNESGNCYGRVPTLHFLQSQTRRRHHHLLRHPLKQC